MAYATDMPAAARRHFAAAEDLIGGQRKDVAGYLYGIAAECAVKAMMIDAGLRPSSNGPRKDDPFFAHFPDLRTMLRDTLSGRRSATITNFINDDSFMNHWSTRMRYSHGRDISDAWIRAWANQAKHAIASIGT